ncbi:MAG TPA: RdgB/HAM1 family non-canonical purine NTP pyrophosphatase [Pyrinomonadaceae bacterium]|nr:RdgB/HAM1 family non-canonical purine NTP pyrophosphatase [Pyrinomonadaceae bacterium]
MMSNAQLEAQSTELLIATWNPGKVSEIKTALEGIPVSLRSLEDFPFIPPPVETGGTYGENATLKATFYSRRTGRFALADDSGLEVGDLDGAPGILSARFGEVSSDQERIDLLLKRLSGIQYEDRWARFVCAISLVHPVSGLVKSFEGEVKGMIALTPKGSNGFGYDSIFIPDGHGLTFGEMSSEVKNIISHRARALANVRAFLKGWLQR